MGLQTYNCVAYGLRFYFSTENQVKTFEETLEEESNYLARQMYRRCHMRIVAPQLYAVMAYRNLLQKRHCGKWKERYRVEDAKTGKKAAVLVYGEV